MEKHPDSGKWLKPWLAEAESVDWEKPQDVKDCYGSVSIIPRKSGKILVFNVKGNDYRMEVHIAYNTGKVFIKRIGTHAEYRKWKF